MRRAGDPRAAGRVIASRTAACREAVRPRAGKNTAGEAGFTIVEIPAYLAIGREVIISCGLSAWPARAAGLPLHHR
jgi:hypothetical protein